MRKSLALAWHLMFLAWRAQGIRLLLVPLGIALLLLSVALSSLYVPGILTGPTRHSLEVLAKNLFSKDLGNVGLALAFLVAQAPLLLGLLLGFFTAGGMTARLADEGARGRLELILAGPYRPKEVAWGLYFGQLLETLAFYALATTASLGMSLGTVAFLGSRFQLPPGYWALALLAPLGLAVWAGLFALLLFLLVPSLAQARLGSGSALQVLANLPGLILLLVVTLNPGTSFTGAFLGAVLLGLLAVVASGPLLDKLLRPELVFT